MLYKVGALITQNDCMLLTMKHHILGTQYDFPMWTIDTGNFPVEVINEKIRSNFNIQNHSLKYMDMLSNNKMRIYLYKIDNWEGKMNAKKYIWVHKGVLMMHKNSLPFSPEMLEKIFK